MRAINGDDDSYDEINKRLVGVKTWRNDAGQVHRDGDLPDVVYADGNVFYHRNGKLHRNGDRPAVFYNGREEYWIDGVRQK